MLSFIKQNKQRGRKPNILDSFAGAVPGFSFSPEAQLYFNRFDIQPAFDVKKKIADFIDGLVSDGIYAKLDEFWIFAINTSHNALLGVKNYKDCSNLNSMVFTIDRGYKGDFTNRAINTNYTPSTDGINFTSSSSSLGIYSRTSQAYSRVDIGGQNAASKVTGIMSGNTTVQNSRIALNCASYDVNFSTGGDTLGLIAITRTSGTNVRCFKSGSFFDRPIGITSITDFPIYIGANNNNGTIASATAKEYTFAFIGGNLTDANIISIATRLEVYLDYIGAGVMP